MIRVRLSLFVGLLLFAGCTNSADDDAGAADPLANVDTVSAASAFDGTAGDLPVVGEVLVFGGATNEVADCQAGVLAAAGIEQVDDLAGMAKAMERLTEQDQQALVDCVN